MLLAYVIKRILWAIPFLFVVSLVAFALIQAPPGDYVTTFAATLAQSGDVVDMERLEALRERYGLDQPFIVQYWRWISNVLQGDFGISFEWQQPVSGLIWERMALSVTLALSTLLFTWAIAFPVGMEVPRTIEYLFKKDGCSTWESIPVRSFVIDNGSPTNQIFASAWNNGSWQCSTVPVDSRTWSTVKLLYH